MKPEPPLCRRVQKWLKARGLSTAPLTGQDARAIAAFVHLVDLLCVSDGAGARHAYAALSETALAMQPSVRHLAKRCIPMVLDWGDEEIVWQKLKLDNADADMCVIVPEGGP